MDTLEQHFFYNERKNILKDIDDFLVMVCRSLKVIKQSYSFDGKLQNLDLLIESLCLIHGLYGYPADGGQKEGRDKQAVKKKLQKIEVKGETFGNIYEQVNEDTFWQFRGDLRLEDQPREPAHLFLELVRAIFDNAIGKAATIGKMFLETLPDANKLKPKVWAMHINKPESFGVSLGVRKFVRPLFIYIKLQQLRAHHDANTSCELSDTKAFEAVCVGSFSSPSLYNVEKKPCNSCVAFFHDLSISSEQKYTFVPFGNCAEYDVIRTRNLDSLLNLVKESWNIFENACQEHFQAFKKYVQGETVMFKNYLEIKEKNSKILMYEQNGLKDFKLKVQDWGKNKTSKKRKKAL